MAIIARKREDLIQLLRGLATVRIQKVLSAQEDDYYRFRYVLDLLQKWPALASKELTDFLQQIRAKTKNRETVAEILALIGEYRPDLA